jgi:hypothetical protein
MATKISSRSVLYSVGVSLSILAGASLASFSIATTVFAQTTTPQPLADFQEQDNKDPFSSRGSGQGSSMFNLIHRAIQGPSKSAEDFNSEQQENLDSAAEEFRARQMELLRNKPLVPSATPPVVTPDGTN